MITGTHFFGIWITWYDSWDKTWGFEICIGEGIRNWYCPLISIGFKKGAR
jgi:hypothetical protein